MEESDPEVLVVCSTTYGVENVVKNIVSRLSDSATLSYLTIPSVDFPPEYLRTDVLNPNVVEFADRIMILKLLYGIFFFWIKSYALIYSERNQYDAIWLNNPRLLVFLPATVRDKVIVTYHSHLRNAKAEYHSGKEGLYYTIFGTVERLGIKRHSEIEYVAVNDVINDELRAIGVPESNVHTIYNGVDVAKFSPERKKDEQPHVETTAIDIPSDELRFLYVGRLEPVKQPLKAIRTFHQFTELYPGDARLLVAGDGTLRREIEEFIKRNAISNVDLLGFVNHEQMPYLYIKADYYILSSKYDPGGPLTLFEALASDLPCVVSEIDQFKFVEKNGLGVALNYDDPTASAKKLWDFVSADENHDTSSREFAKRELTWERRAESYLSIFEHITEKPQYQHSTS